MPLPWFRRKTVRRQPAAPAQAAAAAQVEPAKTASTGAARRGRVAGTDRSAAAAIAAAREPQEDTAPPRRRDRRRPKAEKAERGGEAPAACEKQERKESSDRRALVAPQRRRQPPRRAPLPAAKRELLVSVDVTEQRVAVLEDDRVAEVYLERPERRSIAGNIYKGVVDNVLPGMEAAFVEIGLEKNGFLFVDEIVGPELEGRRPRGRRITDLISRGEEVLVQAVKDPMKTKGARLTTEISLPGPLRRLRPERRRASASRAGSRRTSAPACATSSRRSPRRRAA